MSEIKLNRRYPDSKPEDITDAYMRGFEVGLAMRADENAELREQIETLIMYVESDGTRYWVDDDGNQHFDHSATVKDDADKLRELVRDFYPFALGRAAKPWLEVRRDRMRELGVEV